MYSRYKIPFRKRVLFWVWKTFGIPCFSWIYKYNLLTMHYMSFTVYYIILHIKYIWEWVSWLGCRVGSRVIRSFLPSRHLYRWCDLTGIRIYGTQQETGSGGKDTTEKMQNLDSHPIFLLTSPVPLSMHYSFRDLETNAGLYGWTALPLNPSLQNVYNNAYTTTKVYSTARVFSVLEGHTKYLFIANCNHD